MFLISDKLRKILLNINNPIADDLLKREEAPHTGNYLDHSDGFLTYLPNKNYGVEDVWRPKNRVRGKPARIARHFCSEEHSDRDYELLAYTLNAQVYDHKNLSLIKGKDIHKVYNDFYDQRTQSKMLNSCMVGVSDYRSCPTLEDR